MLNALIILTCYFPSTFASLRKRPHQNESYCLSVQGPIHPKTKLFDRVLWLESYQSSTCHAKFRLGSSRWNSAQHASQIDSPWVAGFIGLLWLMMTQHHLGTPAALHTFHLERTISQRHHLNSHRTNSPSVMRMKFSENQPHKTQRTLLGIWLKYFNSGLLNPGIKTR